MKIYFSSLLFHDVPLLWKYKKTTPPKGPSTYSAKCLYQTLEGYQLDERDIQTINQKINKVPGLNVNSRIALIDDLNEFKKKNPFHIANIMYTKSLNTSAPLKSIGFFKEPSPDKITFYILDDTNKTNFING
jgi:hypothetical protein